MINGLEVELDVAEDPFEWMYDDDDLVLQVCHKEGGGDCYNNLKNVFNISFLYLQI